MVGKKLDHHMILDDIVAHKKKELVRQKDSVSFTVLEKRASEADKPRGFSKALSNPSAMALIAEIKKASPSAGVIRKDFDPIEIGKIYEACGASAISVLTDRQFFQGSISRLEKVRQAVQIPVLRKDFIIDPFQIYEARAVGVDAVLLIAAILSDAQLSEFLHVCKNLQMDALVEVHTAEELNRALAVGAQVIGINNRDLKTFSVHLETTEELIGHIPKGVVVVSESGIKGHEDMKRLATAGVDAVLVGTSLMKAKDIGKKVRELLTD
jgi:indole-3-glycerol phosphate synthase